MVTLNPASPVDDDVRSAVADSLNEFLDARAAQLSEIGAPLGAFDQRARQFLAGGKRLRPAFGLWGYAAASGGLEIPDAVLRAAASLDMLHVSALVHDDVMDASDFRRGLPAAHRQFAADHVADGRRGDADAFGRAGAILFGDMLLVWSAQMFDEAGLDADALVRARPYLEAVRTEVTAGQYLDVLAQSTHPWERTRTPEDVADLEALVRRVVTYKTACYSVLRPLNIGAALAGATPEQQAVLSGYGVPLGRAFQYRDDLLGVFGDSRLTGKESGEDLREGKLTLLVVKTLEHASQPDAARFAELFGRPDLTPSDIDEARRIIVEAGAESFVEESITADYEASLAALDGADWLGDAGDGLRAMADLAAKRTF